jgi:1,4-alpha-glucan branching enzyme
MIAEESTSWPLVTKGADQGGLGFDFKWNMGWMHDTIEYFKRDPFVRRYFHNNLTFGLTYAWSENFILPFSHDEVVHMKGSMLNKMHGTREQKFANLRALYAYMWAHPGKKLLFMGAELGQWREWSDERSLDWHLLDEDEHLGVRTLVRDLNRLLKEHPALYELDVEPRGFQWIDVDNALDNVVAFLRLSRDGDALVCVCNFSAAPRPCYRFGLHERGTYRLILNTDSSYYFGGNALQIDSVEAEEQPWQNRPFSAAVDLPPLTTLWFKAPKNNPGAEDAPLELNAATVESATMTSEAAATSEAATAAQMEHAAPTRAARAHERVARKKPVDESSTASEEATTARDEASPVRGAASTVGEEAAVGGEEAKTKGLRQLGLKEAKPTAKKSPKKPVKGAAKRGARKKAE